MPHCKWDPPFLDNDHTNKIKTPMEAKVTKIICVLQVISSIISIMENGTEALLRHRSERQKIGKRKQQSTGNGPLVVDAKFNLLIVELNLYRTEARNNRPRPREWCYTLGFNCRVKCTAISGKKRTGVGTNVSPRNTSDYLEIALTFSYNLLCND